MAIPVSTTEQFDQWMEGLTTRERREAAHSWRLLGELGLQLEYPYCSAIKGSRFPLRELRPKRGKSPLRIIYAFDPRREAIWEQHLKDVSEEGTK
jgi:hypothetical protein